jgi:hypothetical protein
MVKDTPAVAKPQWKATIVLPITEEHYSNILAAPARFRSEWLDPMYTARPELFPPGFEKGYAMAGHYTS